MITHRIFAAVAVLSFVSVCAAMSSRVDWTAEQKRELVSMSLRMLEPAPADATNRVADDPDAAALRKQLSSRTFFGTTIVRFRPVRAPASWTRCS